MKARNPSTGTLDTVYVKALDSMPVGTQIEFTGDTIPTGWEEVNDYSTTEIDTGKKWIDGSTIYRKVVNLANLNTSTGKVNHGITNFGVPVNIYGYFTRSDEASKTYPLPKIEVSNSAWSIGFESASSTQIGFSIGTSLTSLINGGYLVIEYTKTS